MPTKHADNLVKIARDDTPNMAYIFRNSVKFSALGPAHTPAAYRCFFRGDILENGSLKYTNKSSAVAEMGDRGHNRHGPKIGGGASVPLLRGAGTPSNTMWRGPRSTSVPCGVFIHLAGSIDILQKLGGVGVPFPRVDGSPPITKSPEPRPIAVPSGILVHPTV